VSKKEEKLLNSLQEHLEKDESIEDCIYGLFTYYENGKKDLNSVNNGVLVITSKRCLFFSKSFLGKRYLKELPFEKITHISYTKGLSNRTLEVTLGPDKIKMTGNFDEKFGKFLSKKVEIDLAIKDTKVREKIYVTLAAILIGGIIFGVYRATYRSISSPRSKKATSRKDSSLNSKPATKYKLLNLKNLDLGPYASFPGAKRTFVEIEVPLDTKEEDIKEILTQVIEKLKKRRKVDALAVHLFFEGCKAPYAIAEWAPYGDWEKARSGLPESVFKTSIKTFEENRPKKRSKKKSIKIFKNTTSLSSSAENWESRFIIVTVPKGARAEVLEEKNYGFGIIRVKVKVNLQGKEYIGWVHSWALEGYK